jgi:nucleotide-binding universal stress UspA family protein
MNTGTQKPIVAARHGKSGARNQSPSSSQKGVRRLKWGLRNILVPVDFSEPSKKALSYALCFAKQNRGKITLLHVIEPLPVYTDVAFPVVMGADVWETEAKKAFGKLCDEEHANTQLIRSTLTRTGTPHKEITDAARELKADLIIIATNGRTGLAHVLLGSTTERVVRHAPCPVLVVREKEREFLYG